MGPQEQERGPTTSERAIAAALDHSRKDGLVCRTVVSAAQEMWPSVPTRINGANALQQASYHREEVSHHAVAEK
jgi:hypothetical protein